MPVAFVDLAKICAPTIAIETIAAVVSLESGFHPYAIRINSGPPLLDQPASKSEAIELVTSLVAARQDIQIGLGGLGLGELNKLKLSISDAFDPCLNLKAAATLLDGYRRLALRTGADAAQAENVMLQSLYGRGDPSLGKVVRYDEQVRQEMVRLSPKLVSLSIAEPPIEARIDQPADIQDAPAVAKRLPQADETASWDVFASRRRSSVLVFQNDRSEQSE
ncbi:transglycosylase SLT domain-containing protein [Rhizobium azibense]|uniref:Type IV secretion system protein VirB1 n=1 Tax=Rhizobium azibense TaxID=1136135 RepID=A0A4R3RDL4_9HYPH|nr:transglycosylase SLT domain-containing protein [Rhizobium azibense]TCU32604.1 type IV secretion system protein VirB1 [Rhizobium azibense]